MASTSSNRSQPSPSSCVPSIIKLDEAVVNRIAAGEVVHRPASAVKEMMENSLDAGSTSITITLKDGGLKLLQITDDGHGIRKSDLAIVCERFTTSKLRKFNDLDHIQTYGFRGEALASITHVAHVTIMTMTDGSSNAWKARYSDGKVVPFKPGRKAAPVACAGVRGTQITVSDMFYNVSTRRKALKSSAEEFKRVLEVVSRYAIHFGSRGVSFTCKKYGQGLPALHTLKGNTTLQNIAAVYGSQLSNELVPFNASENWLTSPPALAAGRGGIEGGSTAAGSSSSSPEVLASDRNDSTDSGIGGPDTFAYSAKGFVSNANFNRATGIFLLFINDRLVQSAKLKRAFDNVYSEYLPRKRHSFVYLSVTLPSHHCDVNVHPTKNQVHFLHEELLIEKLQAALAHKLQGANQSRTYQTQALLPTVIGASGRHGSGSGDGDRSEDEDDLSTQHPGAEALRGRFSTPSPASQSSRSSSSTNNSRGGNDGGGQADDHTNSSGSQRPRPSTAASASSTPSTGSNGRGGRGAGSGLRAGQGADVGSKKKRVAPNPSRMVRTDSRVTLVNSYFRPLSESQSETTNRNHSDWHAAEGEHDDNDREGQDNNVAVAKSKAGGSVLSRILQRRDNKKRKSHPGCNGCPDCGDGDGEGGKAYAAVAAVDWRTAAAAVAKGKRSGKASQHPPRRKRRLPIKEVPYPPIMLTSVENLLKHVAKRGNASLRKVVAEHVYIGAVDEEMALLQFNTKMYLVNHWEMSKEYFYQRAVRNFSHFPRIALQPAASLERLLHIAYSTADIHSLDVAASCSATSTTASAASEIGGGAVGTGASEEAAGTVVATQVKEGVALLVSKADMLDEYFKISITPDGFLESLPQLEPELEHTPQLDGLPRFVYNLANKVDWSSEQMCFRDVAEELAFMYSLLPVRQLKHQATSSAHSAGTTASAADEFEDTLNPRAKHLLSQVLFPAFRAHLLPPAQWLNTHVFMEVACLQKLYRIFERC